VCFIIGYVGFV
jgi:hypothetical protein